jgi:hypothetical protein
MQLLENAEIVALDVFEFLTIDRNVPVFLADIAFDTYA